MPPQLTPSDAETLRVLGVLTSVGLLSGLAYLFRKILGTVVRMNTPILNVLLGLGLAVGIGAYICSAIAMNAIGTANRNATIQDAAAVYVFVAVFLAVAFFFVSRLRQKS